MVESWHGRELASLLLSEHVWIDINYLTEGNQLSVSASDVTEPSVCTRTLMNEGESMSARLASDWPSFACDNHLLQPIWSTHSTSNPSSVPTVLTVDNPAPRRIRKHSPPSASQSAPAPCPIP